MLTQGYVQVENMPRDTLPAHEAGDESTVALVPDRMRVHEKTACMLQAIQ